MKNKFLIGLVAVVLIAVAMYFFYFKKSKPSNAKTIIKFAGYSDYAALLTFDEDYLQAWAKEIAKGHETFTVKGVIYYTKGGSAKR